MLSLRLIWLFLFFGFLFACELIYVVSILIVRKTFPDISDSRKPNRSISILEEINPAFKQTKDQDRKIKNLEDKVDRMGSSFDELKELLIKKLG